MTKLFKIAALAVVSSLALPVAQAVNLKSVHFVSHKVLHEWGHAGSQTTRFSAEYEARDRGYDHVCEVRYSTDGWRTYSTVRATFDRFVGNYERWKASASIPGFRSPVLHAFTCRDLGASFQVYSPSSSTWVTSYGLELSTPVFVANVN